MPVIEIPEPRDPCPHTQPFPWMETTMTTATPTPEASAPADVAVQQIPLADIDRSRNHRIAQPQDEAKIKELMESIEAAGQLQTVRVYEAHEGQSKDGLPYILGFGWRRCCALERLGKTAARAEVFPPAMDAEIEAARAIENLHRQDIGPMEEVLAVSHLLGAIQNRTMVEQERLGALENPHAYVASQLGQSERWVRDRDYLHRLRAVVQYVALATQLPAGHLREIAKVGDAGLQFKIAVDAAGGLSWWFGVVKSLEEKRLVFDAHHKKDVDAWLARTAEGSHKRMTLDEVKQRVDAAQCSLKAVPWVYELPVIDKSSGRGGEEIRACQACPHNSETDRTLFGVEEDTANPRGICLNPACFARKTTAAEQAKQDTLAAFSRYKTTPPAEQIDEVAPKWLKPSTARGYVQREVKKRVEEKAASSSNGSSSVGGSGYGRKLTAHEKAIEKFDKALWKWHEAATAAILDAARQEPARWAGLCVLVFTDAWANHGWVGYGTPGTCPGWVLPRVGTYRAEQADEPTPTPPKPLTPALRGVINCLQRCDQVALLELAMMEPRKDMLADISLVEDGASELALAAIAEAFDVEIPPCPTWDDFKPKPKPAKPTKKTTKKKTTKKKTTKKKAGGAKK